MHVCSPLAEPRLLGGEAMLYIICVHESAIKCIHSIGFRVRWWGGVLDLPNVIIRGFPKKIGILTYKIRETLKKIRISWRY